MLRFLTAGESHGQGLQTIIEGVPAGLPLLPEQINRDLARRQQGYGRGGRMRIETDTAEIIAGVRHGKTLGTPIGLFIQNRDWKNWGEKMAVEPVDADIERIAIPRPGHADLVGALKYGHEDLRNVIERASARETAARVAAGAVARRLLEELSVRIIGHVLSVGSVAIASSPLPYEEIQERSEASEMRCIDPEATDAMKGEVDKARRAGNTLGGIFEIIAYGMPPGVGSYSQYDRRLSGRLGGALMSIHAMKGVEIGLGFEAARRMGSQVHDEITYENGEYSRRTNNAGGMEGGVSNGQPIVCRVAMKPISTLVNPLGSVSIETHEPVESRFERSDICAVPAAATVGEAMVALVLAPAMQEKFGGDSLDEMKRNMKTYLESLESR
jgi:chorismate synthase